LGAELEQTLRQPIGAWQRELGPAIDVAVSSRVRLARNLADLPFPPRMQAADVDRLLRRVEDAARRLPAELGRFAFCRLDALAPLDRQVLVEKHLISPQHAQQARGGLLLRGDEQLSVMVLEEDHLRLQALCPGLQPSKAWELAGRLDDALERELDWAFSEELGYLATCPTNVGTGLRASVMLHLPALAWTGRIGPLLSELGKVGVVARGLYGEGTAAAGNLFQVSNQTSLGQSEQELVAHLEAVAQQIVARERSTREALLAERRAEVEDRVWRAYGILTTARLLSSAEALQLLSDLRLGCELHVLPPLRADRWAELLVLTRAGFLQRQDGQAGPDRRDRRRAEMLRLRLQAALTPEPGPPAPDGAGGGGGGGRPRAPAGRSSREAAAPAEWGGRVLPPRPRTVPVHTPRLGEGLGPSDSPVSGSSGPGSAGVGPAR
jgi:protein arginine kinase